MVSVAHGIVDQAKHLGISTSGILHRVGVGSAGEARIPLPEFFSLWEELAARSADPELGVSLAEVGQEPGILGAVDYQYRSSKNLGAALGALERHARLLQSDWEPRITLDRAGAIRFAYSPDPYAPRHLSEWVIASCVAVGRQMVDAPWAPLRVAFTHDRPPEWRADERFFRCDVHFGQTANELVLDASLLTLPNRMADLRLECLMEEAALRLGRDVVADAALPERLLTTIRQALATGDVQLDRVARDMGMSGATLKRRLRRDGLPNYRDLVTRARMDLALHMLLSNLPIAAVAESVGYSEPSAFHRAFRRWTGVSPRTHSALGRAERSPR
jgi:AraC-like DNA-binding protein